MLRDFLTLYMSYCTLIIIYVILYFTAILNGLCHSAKIIRTWVQGMSEYVYTKIGVKCILQLNTVAEPEQQILAQAQDA